MFSSARIGLMVSDGHNFQLSHGNTHGVSRRRSDFRPVRDKKLLHQDLVHS